MTVITPASVRWAGFAGSVATAVTAYLGGAGPVRVPSVNPGTLLSGAKGVALPLCWLLGTALLITAWWYGRRVAPSLRWVLVTCALWFLPVLPFLPLGSADVYSYACQGWVQRVGGDPYAAGVAGSGCPWVSSVASSWADSPAPYGPLFLLLAAGAVLFGGTSLDAVIAGLRVIALAGLVLTAWGVPALARRAGIDPVQATWTVLAGPLVLVHLVSGAHNDALLIGLIVAGLAVVPRPARRCAEAPAIGQPPAVVRGRAVVPLVVAGLLLGLAVSVKATAIVVVPFAVLAVVPPGSALRTLWRPAVILGGSVVAGAAVVSVLSGRGVGWIGGLLRSGDTVAWTSPSTAVGLTIETVTGLSAIGVTRAVGVAVLAVLLVWLWWRARRGDALIGAGLALAATVLCAPVFHPWYATWPLAVLAATLPAGTTIGRWLIGLCAFAATLTTPAGYNWALYTRIPGAVLVTVLLLAGLAYLARKPRRRAEEVAP
ncbi:polyprenol phosphomannose-dependent alpha 1,6 mannosyltransferase MptB [Actinoplanes sp. TRM 88003]|uniref:Polyprenol phosphomannose-dependent alpha 1,6 mannosyltransferase MptB n=1 Tax=Paractinoplanes aksuensis TaxID=2939490 RepID=A0ABT1DYW4_9ACTN|nr:polyprenol phosphomannose-dependent alpha 1,6 mannosyltransferase MptB [Actinoplanes aksuensis]MCO8275977.1 polyprenol phosphomannose-dependent alpha 1,6 mannosyltransferase MptB [Actinoplanes aksuensis]